MLTTRVNLYDIIVVANVILPLLHINENKILSSTELVFIYLYWVGLTANIITFAIKYITVRVMSN